MKIDGQKLFELLRDEHGSAEAGRIIGKIEALSDDARTPDDGGSAFPNFGGHDSRLIEDYGMSLRDYFAARAMQAFVPEFLLLNRDSGLAIGREFVARLSYELADVMLKAREAA